MLSSERCLVQHWSSEITNAAKNYCGVVLTCVGVTQTETTFQVSCQLKMSNVLQIIASG